MTQQKQCDHIAEKLSGYLDNELTQQESQLVSLHIKQCPHCSKAYEELKALKSAVADTHYPNMEQDKLEAVLNDMTTHRIQDASWIAIILGCSILAVFIVYQFLFDSSVSIFMKLIMSLIWGGAIGLFISALRHRLIIRKNDKYNKVNL